MIIKNNEELKKLIKNGIIDCSGKDLICNFNINVEANIKACNILADNINSYDINALNINAYDINALNINAQDIVYYAVCCAYNNIICESIKGRRNNNKHFVLDGKIIIDGEERK